MIATEKKTETNLECDVLIVGAGPAGATAAYYIAKAGFKVIVLDSEKLPRKEISGDFISPGAIKQLDELGITQQNEFHAANTITRASIYLDGKKLVSNEFPTIDQLPKLSRIIPRNILDKLIHEKAEQAGAKILEGFSVINVQENGDCLTVTTRDPKEHVSIFQARLLIGTDGSDSIIAQHLRGSSGPKQKRAYIIQAYYENVVGDPHQADVYYAKDSFPGYSWLFPIDKYRANVGLGVIIDAVPSMENPKQLLLELINNDAAMKSRLQNATMQGEAKTFFFNVYDPNAPIVADRIMLIGEAADLTNSFNGEEIQFALCSAKWASETAAASLNSNNLSQQSLSTYSQRVNSELGTGFNLSTLLLGLIKNRNLNPVWLKMLAAMGEKSKTDPEYACLTSGIFSGMIFPNEKIAAQVLIGAVQEATLTAGLNTVGQALNNPAELPQTVIQITETGFQVAKAAAEDPIDFLNWGVMAGSSLAEFAAGFFKQTVKSAEGNSNP